MTVISIEYRAKAVGGLGFDEIIINALKGTGARRLSSGCCLFGEAMRDIQFSVPAKNLKDAKRRLNMVAHNNTEANLQVFAE